MIVFVHRRAAAVLTTLLAAVSALAALPAPSLAVPSEGVRGAATAASETVILRPAVTITGAVLRLGDVFANVGDKAGLRIGSAPPAGSPLTLDAQTLQRIAAAHGLVWRPTSMRERAIVERDSVAITPQQVADAVLVALEEKGVATEGVVVEPTLGTRQLYRPREAQLQIDSAITDAAGRRFSAVLNIVSSGEPKQSMAITGRLERTIEVPVLVRSVRSGEVIEANDVGVASLPDRISANAVRDRNTLVGQSARRALAAGAPIMVSDLRATNVVEKGQMVTVLLETPGLQLSARGVALDAGADGDTIRVLNERSKATIQGVVTGSGTVRVVAMPGGPR